MIIREEMWQLSDIQQQLLITQVSTNKFVFHYRQGRAGVLKDFGLKNKGKTLKQAEKEFNNTALQLQQQGYKLISKSTNQPSNQPNLQKLPTYSKVQIKADLSQVMQKADLLAIFHQQLKLPIDLEFWGNHIQEISPTEENLDRKKVFDKIAASYYFYFGIIISVVASVLIILSYLPAHSFELFFQSPFYLLILAANLVVIGIYYALIYYKTREFIASQTVERLSQRHFYGVAGGILYYLSFQLDYVQNYINAQPLKNDKIYLFHADKVEKLQNGLVITEENNRYELFLNAQTRDNLHELIQQLKKANSL